MDGEHRVQVGLLVALRGAVAEGRDRAAIDEIFDRLLDYTKMHFVSEQLLMRLYAYPRYQQHLDEHADAIEQLQRVREQYTAGEVALTLSSLDTLTREIVGHIRRTDRAFGTYVLRLDPGRG